MSWVVQKILLGVQTSLYQRLRKYFHIEDDRNVQLSLLGKRQLRCTNLTLKTQTINASSDSILIKSCSIGLLEISFDSKKSEFKKPLNVKIDRVNLTLMFNLHRQVEQNNEEKKEKSRPVIEDFYKAVGSQEEYQQRNFIQQEIFQLVRLFAEYTLGGLLLQISNIDVSVEYLSNETPKYFGVQIDQIEARRQLIPKSSSIGEDVDHKGNELFWQAKGISAYFGIKLDDNKIFRESEGNPLNGNNKIQKKYILNKTTFSSTYNFTENNMVIVSKQISIDFQDILIYQVLNFLKFAKAHTGDKQPLRPGEGNIRTIKISKGRTLEISQGTLNWWKLLGDKILEKFKRKPNLNILNNTKFRKYLYCLLYRYTYGAHPQLQKIVDQYEYFKTDMQILHSNKLIISKINQIQNSKNQASLNPQVKVLLVFLLSIEKNDSQLKHLKLKKVSYAAIKKSDIIVNYQNCKKFIKIKQAESINCLKIDFNINLIEINIKRNRLFNVFRNDVKNLNPLAYGTMKNRILQYYCNQTMLNCANIDQGQMCNPNVVNPNIRLSKGIGKLKIDLQKNEEVNYISITASSLKVDYNSQGTIHLSVPEFVISDLETQLNIMKISNLIFSLQNMHPEAYGWKISAEKRMEVNVDLFFVLADSRFVEKVLTIMSYITQTVEEQPEQKKNFMTQFIAKKVPNHPIFNTYENTSKEIHLKKVIIATPVFDKDRNYEISIKGVKYTDQLNGKPSFDISQSLIVRSNMKNLESKVNPTHYAVKYDDEVVLMANTRQFSGQIEKDGSKDRDVFSLVIPFILVQLSIKDIYYINNLLKVWLKILSNPYYFPPKPAKKAQVTPQINPNAIKFAKKMKKFSKHETIQDITLEGIQFCLLTDYQNEGNNLVFDFLIDRVNLKTSTSYTQETYEVKVRDIFMRHFMSLKGINRDSLQNFIKYEQKLGYGPILYEKEKKQDANQQSNAKMQKNEQLLLFMDPKFSQEKDEQECFLKLEANSNVSLENNVSLTKTEIKIVPIYLFYSLQFTQSMNTILDVIRKLTIQNLEQRKSKFQEDSFGMPLSSYQTTAVPEIDNINILDQKDVEIMAASQFEEINRISIFIEKLNFLAVKNSSVVYTISVAEISVKHKTEPYVQRFFFNANQLIIVDTSEQAGPQPIIINLQKSQNTSSYPMKGSFTTYKNQIMKFKQKKSAFFALQIQSIEINFLKKKVLELVNFLMILLKQVGILGNAPPPANTTNSKVGNDLPLRYSIEIIKPRVRLFRSSLSQQGFKAASYMIQVRNYKKMLNTNDVNEQAINRQQSIVHGLQEQSDSLHEQSNFYDLDNNKGNEQIQFQSFEKEEQIKINESTQTIYINIQQFCILGVQFWNLQFHEIIDRLYNDHGPVIETMMNIPLISVEFFSPQMALNIPFITGLMKDEDYRVLIRMTQQNISEAPLLFVDTSVPQSQVKISFKTTFSIDTIKLNVLILEENLNQLSTKLQKILVLNLDNLSGVNELWTNGEIVTQLSIHEMELTADETDMTIIQRLNEDNIQQLPELPKTRSYTDVKNYPEFKILEKEIRKKLKLLLNNEDNFNFMREYNPRDAFLTEDSIGNKQNTNAQKIAKWMRGMIQKCAKCCKKNGKDHNEKIIENLLLANLKNYNQEDSVQQIVFADNKLKNRKAPMIFRIQDVLDFEHEINWPQLQAKKKLPNMIYLNFVIRPNGEKQMYMQAKKIQVLMENSKGLLGLAQFFGRPYAVADIPENVKKFNFNNAKPFKMLIQVDDTLAQIQSHDQKGKLQKICVLCDLVYDNEMRGDGTIGPGLSRLRVESVAKILFMSENFKNPIDLSDSFKLIFLAQNRIPYGNDQRNESIQQILLKPHQRLDWNISFFIPAFALKAIYRVVMSNFSKIQEQDQAQHQFGDMSSQSSDDKIQKSHIHRAFSHEEGLSTGKTKSDKKLNKNTSTIQKQKQPQNDIVQKYKQQQLKKPLAAVVQKQAHMIRTIYISEITFEIESKLESSYIKSKIKDIMYSQLYINNKINKINTRNIILTLDVNYWNLRLGVYEPCIQPWKCQIEQVVHQRDNLSSSNLKVCSQLSPWNLNNEYVNDLNVNISQALYKTFQELMIVYQQENYDENEDCIDLTSIDNSDYDQLFDRVKKEDRPPMTKFKVFPKILVKSFRRIFKAQNQNLKKFLDEPKGIINSGKKVFLFHSYFDHFRRKKRITYRTPYRIFNSTNVDLALWFWDPKDSTKWRAIVRIYQYYAIPSRIYTSDFLVHVSDDLENPPHPKSVYISVKYLVQVKGKEANFKLMPPESIIWKNIFKFSSNQNVKKIDHRGLILNVGKHSFVALNVISINSEKSDLQTDSKQTNSYCDCYCIIHSPIIIDNYTYINTTLKLDRKKNIMVPKNERVQINSSLPKDLESTIIEFTNDNIHQEHHVFKEKQQDNKYTYKVMEINNLQSMRLVIIRYTNCLCQIKIYTEWNISNFTNQSFQLRNSDRLLLIDNLSFCCLSNISQKGIDMCILNEQKFAKKIKPNNIADNITLARKSTSPNLAKIIKARNEITKKQCCGCSSRKIYEHIDFVLNSAEDPIQPLLCTKIQIRYRYQITNRTNYQIRLCQHSSDLIIAQMKPFDPVNVVKPVQIFYFDFVEKNYFIEVDMEVEAGKMITVSSCQFQLDQFPGSTFVIKVKKDTPNVQLEDYQNRFYYFQFDVKKIDEETIIFVSKADFNDFPIYIDNVTDYSIKIKQGEDEFIVRPQNRVPFAWSHLNSSKYKLQAQIQNANQKYTQNYEFGNKSSFDPIKIVDNTKQRKRKVQNLYLKQQCYVLYEYMSISTICLVILDLFDNKMRIHNKEYSINTEIKMQDVQKLEPLASKIELHFSGGRILQLVPPANSITLWVDKLQKCINENVVDKIFFTIQSYNNSRIFFFRTGGNQEYESSKNQFIITHLNVSLIVSTLEQKPEQLILLYCGDICYVQHDKQNRLNYKDLELSESEKIISIKKIKVSNQAKDAINPVVLSQIKKTNFPFLQLRLIQEKLHLEEAARSKYTTDQQLKMKQQEQRINHYKEISFFMDEAQVMVEAALFMKMFGLKKSFDQITNQYAVGQKIQQRDQDLVLTNTINEINQNNQAIQGNQGNRISFGPIAQVNRAISMQKTQQYQQVLRRSVMLVKIPNEQKQEKQKTQVFINYMQIKPLKMTVSVSLDHNTSENVQLGLIAILRYIPFGIENAIIEIQSYQFFHVFYGTDELQQQLMKFYKKQAWNQIYKNAGSYDMFVPIQLIGGVGNGVKKIFYDPIYQFVKKKQIKAVGKTLCQGLLSFIVFLVSFFFKLINLCFKILAVFTFDTQYKTKRQSFRKQIFKSPVEGAVLGAKNFWKVFKSVFTNFTSIRTDYEKYSYPGYLWGFLVCILKIGPWCIKIVVSLYDWFYVIGLGLVNWGYYEQSAMKSRSRPRRIFYQGQIVQYNYLLSLGYEIILKNQLQEIENEQIFFVKSVEGGDDSNHLILSNYRIIHSYTKITSMQQVKLYQLSQVESRYNEKKKQYRLYLRLSIPNIHKVLFLFSYNVSEYKINVADKQNLINFLKYLKHLCLHQKLNVRFIDHPSIQEQLNCNEMIFMEIVGQNIEDRKQKQDMEDSKMRERDKQEYYKTQRSMIEEQADK